MPHIYRMEDAAHYGPFNPEVAERVGIPQVLRMWDHVPWANATMDGLEALDPTHPHHIKDVLKMPGELADAIEFGLLPMPLKGHWLVGCRDLRQFHHWFPQRALPDFSKCGMGMSIYDCPEEAILRGRYQLMFDKERATLVKHEPLMCPDLLAA